jgi:hypothetical protein
MATSIDVILPKDYNPKFPNKCVVCQGLPTSTVNLMLSAPFYHLFKWKRTAVPICSACKFQFLWQRWSRRIIALAIGIVLILYLAPYFEGWPRLTRKLAIVGLGTLGLLPYALFEMYRPRIFDITANWDNIDYEFASETYAAEFRELNRPYLVAEGTSS